MFTIIKIEFVNGVREAWNGVTYISTPDTFTVIDAYGKKFTYGKTNILKIDIHRAE